MEGNLVGAYNLQTLDVSNTKIKNLILPNKDTFTSLRNLNISQTEINSLNFDGSETVSYLDLTNFADLSNI